MCCSDLSLENGPNGFSESVEAEILQGVVETFVNRLADVEGRLELIEFDHGKEDEAGEENKDRWAEPT